MAPLRHASLSLLTIGKQPAPPAPAYLSTQLDPWEGLPGELLADLGRLNEGADLNAEQALARGRVAVIERQVLAEARALGFTFARTTPGALEAMRACLRAYREAWAGVLARDAGKVVETPALIPLPQPPQEPQNGQGQGTQGSLQGRRIGDALEAWTHMQRRPEKTVKVFTRHALRFSTEMGDPSLSTLKRADAVRFRDILQRWAVTEGKTAATADNVLVSIKTLANVARDREWMETNPFERLTVAEGGKDSEGREPWTHDELRHLFNAPLYGAYSIPPADSAINRKAGLDAAYWVPLLALYTGGRAGEICQLWTDDLSEEAGGFVVEFREDSERGLRLKVKADRRSKKAGSWRAVPVHSDLIALGFADYLQAIIALHGGSPGPLFPAIPKEGANGAGGQFGQWFGEFKRGQGFTTTTKTLHSFRHVVASELRLLGATDAQADAITGHAGAGEGRTTYSATIRREAERLRSVVELLTFPGLVLPRVFKVPAWRPEVAA